MIFTSIEFLMFFAVVLVARSAIRGASAEKWVLVVASLVFYASWSVWGLAFIVSTSLVDFSVARALDATADERRRRHLLFVSLCASLGLLVLFKYGSFFLENTAWALRLLGVQVGDWRYSLQMPPAISFYTFASVGYVLDVYYRRIPARSSPRDYTLFVTFFPKLLSGPIARAKDLLPQFDGRRRVTAQDVEVGLSFVLMGAVQKLVIADQIATPVAQTFTAPNQFDGQTLLLALFGYAVQLYCDFAGYSSMAVGFARILGFRLPENFQFPFSSSSVTEFWRRWHISLSQWFRDYFFLPLELATRNHPRPTARASTNLFVTMVVIGLWHGASWNFVAFGMVHGLSLATHKTWTALDPLKPWKDAAAVRLGWNACAHVLTLSVVLVGVVFFGTRNFDDASAYLQRMMTWESGGAQLNSPYIMAAVAILLVVHLVVHKDRNLTLELTTMPVPVRVTAYASLLLALALFGAAEANPFMYFQF